MWQRTPAQQQQEEQQPESRVLCKPQFSIQLFLVAVAVAAVACIKCSRSLARPRNEADGRQAGRPAPT